MRAALKDAALNFVVRRAMSNKVSEELYQALKNVADSMNIELVEIEFKNGREPSFTIFVDTETGIDLDTCAEYHRAIDLIMDEYDPTEGKPYTLNVSSPGLDRPLKTERDFIKCTGEKVEIKLYAPLKGKKFFEGVLVAHDENTVTVNLGKEEVKFNLSQIAKINRAIEV